MSRPFNKQAFANTLKAVVVGLFGKGADKVTVVWGDADTDA